LTTKLDGFTTFSESKTNSVLVFANLSIYKRMSFCSQIH